MPYCNELFYRIYENGDSAKGKLPLVLLHGSGGSHMAWPLEIRRLRGRRVIALDLPGHGRSAGASCQSLEALTACLKDFLLACGLRRVLLAGHSLGAMLALEYACANPKHAQGLILLACGSRFDLPPILFDDLLRPNHNERFIEHFNALAFDPACAQTERRAILEPLKKVRASTLLLDLGICHDYRLASNLDDVSCPAAIINGASDRITTPSTARQLASALPQAALSILPQCGHMLIYEKTTLINSIMRDFFQQQKI